jgi:hypothetical protein
MPCKFVIKITLQQNNPGKQRPLLNITLKKVLKLSRRQNWIKFSLIILVLPNPPAHPEDGDGNSSRNVVKPSHLVAAVCLRKVHWITIRYTTYSLTAFGLACGGSSIAHIYTRTIHRTTQRTTIQHNETQYNTMKHNTTIQTIQEHNGTQYNTMKHNTTAQ